MASVAVQASFMLNTGELVDMKTTLTEGTEGELLTSTDYAVAATSIGQFADGKVITQIIQPPSAPNGISYAYVDRRGEILCILPVSLAGIQNEPEMPLRSFALQAGDTIRVMASTAASRLFSYSVVTNSGVHAIFTGTPSGAANTSLTHIKSGQGLGASLTGQAVVCHFATSVDGSKLDSGGGVYILNDKGLPVGGVAATNPIKLQPEKSTMGGAPIFLNFVARVTTNA
tara:strand:+ start:357 stop:1043 length:687 start_codon:yes stop_codon:yes gene_type:complete